MGAEDGLVVPQLGGGKEGRESAQESDTVEREEGEAREFPLWSFAK